MNGYCWNKPCTLFNVQNYNGSLNKFDSLDTRLYCKCGGALYIEPYIEKKEEEKMDIQTGICLNCANLISEDLSKKPLNEIKCNHCNSTDFILIDLNVLSSKNTKNSRNIMLLVGPTGAGKNYLQNGLKDLNYVNVPSVTTRKLREGEEEGIDYITISNKEFDGMLKNNKLCECIDFGPSKYGVSVKVLVNLLWNTYHNLIIIVEPNGYKQMLNWFLSNPRFIVPLNITISSVFLDIPRSERFLNMLKDTSKINFYYSMQQALENIIIPDRNNLGLDEQKDIDLFIGHLDNILNRLVRNGDNISNEFKLANGDIQELIKQLALENITVSSHILTSKENVNEFILSKKNEKYNFNNLFEDIKKIEDAEILYKLFELVKNKITSKEK